MHNLYLYLCRFSARVFLVYPEDADSRYQYALRHVADDCLQILFRLLFGCQTGPNITPIVTA